MECGVVVKGRVTIDTRPPFRSVKEAVALFGEKVLVAQVYRTKIEQVKMIKNKSSSVEGGKKQVEMENKGGMKIELEETKQRLENSREQNMLIELEEKRRELQGLKSKNCFSYENPETIVNPEIEEIKRVSDNDLLESNQCQTLNKFVSFASPPSLVKEMDKQQQNSSFVKDRKNKSLGWLFSRKRRNA